MAQVDRDGLRLFVSEARRLSRSLVSVPVATSMVEKTGLHCRLACKGEIWPGAVRLTTLTRHDVRPIEGEVEGPFATQPLRFDREHQVGPEAWERGARFDWPMDHFGLLIKWRRREAFVHIVGPHMAQRCHAWLADNSVPSVEVADLADALVSLLTGKRVDSGPYVGAGFQAAHMSESAADILDQYLEETETGSAEEGVTQP